MRVHSKIRAVCVSKPVGSFGFVFLADLLAILGPGLATCEMPGLRNLGAANFAQPPRQKRAQNQSTNLLLFCYVFIALAERVRA